MIPDVQYVKTPDGAHIAYQVFGQGAFDVVYVPGFAYNVEHAWRLEPVARAYRRLAGVLSRHRVRPTWYGALRPDRRSQPSDAGCSHGRHPRSHGRRRRRTSRAPRIRGRSEPVRRLRREQSVEGPRGGAPRVGFTRVVGAGLPLGLASRPVERLPRAHRLRVGNAGHSQTFIVDWGWPSHVGDAAFQRECGVVPSSVGEPGRGCWHSSVSLATPMSATSSGRSKCPCS